MESDKLTGKLAKCVLLLKEYNFEVILRAGITNLDADGFSHNLSPSNKDMTRTKWHGDCDQEAVPRWHAAVYRTLFCGAAIEVSTQGSNDETDRPQAIANIWEDFPISHKLQ